MRPATRSGYKASQDGREFFPFLDLLDAEGVSSYLEIGARHGDTFFDVMRRRPPGSLGVAVDLPGGSWGKRGTDSDLQAAATELRGDGYQIAVILGDSGGSELIKLVSSYGPFDAALIDGDHRYEGVRRDWLNYGPLARLAAFHDIAGDGVVQRSSGEAVEVPRLWRELKAEFRHVEFVAEGAQMGIGVLWRR